MNTHASETTKAAGKVRYSPPPNNREEARRLLYSPQETAGMLGTSRQWLYNEISAGRIAAVKLGRLTRIPITEIERLSGCTIGATE
jgi:excisionase family DNA binding protein